MKKSWITRYLGSCFWLWLPPLAISFLLWAQLPPAFGREIFWKDIPQFIGTTENALRLVIILLSLLMAFEIKSASQKTGLGLYLLGLVLYAASQIVLVLAPESGWSTSVVGFTAPAYTPLFWLLGISMIGNRLISRQIPWHPAAYFLLSLAFAGAHTAHATLVFARNY